MDYYNRARSVDKLSPQLDRLEKAFDRQQKRLEIVIGLAIFEIVGIAILMIF